MKKVHVTIDGIDVFVPEDYTILEAAKEADDAAAGKIHENWICCGIFCISGSISGS